MRCTKCSFISFDDLLTCAKCASDLSRLSKELNGTCTETSPDFFLSMAIKNTGSREDGFSDSQMLPPIDQSEMNFDDTTTGVFSRLASPPSETADLGFDDSLSIDSEDDVDIELGDIMPIDFEEFDTRSGSSEATEPNAALNYDDLNGDLDKTDTVLPDNDKENDLGLGFGVDASASELDFDDELSGIDFDDSSSKFPPIMSDTDIRLSNASLVGNNNVFEESDKIQHDHDLFEQSLESTTGFDQTSLLNNNFDLDDTHASVGLIGDEASPLELDDSFAAELSGTSSLDLSASGDFELDPALLAELSAGADVTATDAGDALSVTESISSDTVDLENVLEIDGSLTAQEVLSFAQIEDLTGDYPPLREDDDAALSGLDLGDIDVSDLVDSTDGAAALAMDKGVSVDQGGFLNLPGVDDTVRVEPGSVGFGGIDLQIDDNVVSVSEGALGENDEVLGLDDKGFANIELDALPQEIDFAAEGMPLDFSNSSLDDTFREGEPAGDLAASLADDSLDDELVLDFAADSDVSSTDIDALALDADFEAFLNEAGAADGLPEIDLISDDDEETGFPDKSV